MRRALATGTVALHRRVLAEMPTEQDPREALVLIHGLLGSGANLGVVARALESDYRVVMLDLRNHGRSPHWPSMSLAEMVDDIVAVLDEEGIEAAHVLGHSLGGKVAMQMALSYPQRVLSLMVEDIAPVQYPPHHNEVFDALASVDLSALKNRQHADELLARFFDDVGYRQFLLKNLYRDGEGQWAWRANVAAIEDNYDVVCEAPAGEAYEGPTVFLRGELSNYVRPDNEPAMRRLFPQSSVVVIHGASHWVHADQPVAFNNAVREFLQQASA